MKKFLVSILTFLYLSSSIGATVHMHYCMDKLVSWGFSQKETNKKACDFCGMAKKPSGDHCVKATSGCCKDKQKLVKLESDQKVSLFEYSFVKYFDGPFFYPIETGSVYKTFSPVLEYPTTHAPPFKEKVPVFIRNCVFRI